MADIDVGVLSLSTPPTSAPRTTYRPAVQVRNNGVAAAVASGSLSIFDLATGLKVTDLALGPKTINPGVTASVLAQLTWTPAAGDVGKTFMFYGFVSCPEDMVPANNYLAPVYVAVTGETPPPAPVADHAQQHEDGGGDELNVTGLSGALGEPQTPTDHAAAHQSDGADQLDVSGLPGLLAEPQPPAVHSNTAHTVPYCALEDAAALVAGHNVANPAHELSANLEHVANKDQPEGYPGLDAESHVTPSVLAPTFGVPAARYLKFDPLASPQLSWAEGVAPPYGAPAFPTGGLPRSEGSSDNAARCDHVHGGSGGVSANALSGPLGPAETPLHQVAMPAGWPHGGAVVRCVCGGHYSTGVFPSTLTIRVRIDPETVGAPSTRASLVLPLPANQTNQSFYASIDVHCAPGGTVCIGFGMRDADLGAPMAAICSPTTTGVILSAPDNVVWVTVELTNGATVSYCPVTIEVPVQFDSPE